MTQTVAQPDNAGKPAAPPVRLTTDAGSKARARAGTLSSTDGKPGGKHG